jgi:polyhydroxybutyrate depolymerase
MRMAAVRWAGAMAVLAVVLTSCASTPPPPSAAPVPVVNRTVLLDSPSGPRTALVHRPNWLRRNAPLVVVLHGAYGTAERTRASFGWDALADRSGFEVAYPNGFGKTWNAGNCCGGAHARGVDDVAFLHRLVEQLVTDDGVDQHRVYAVGMSNGAMMTYAWACSRPDDLAGIGPVAGALVTPCKPTPTMKVVAIHGTADRNVPINGGVGPRSVSHYNYPSVAATIAPFLAADGCGPLPKRTDKPPVQLNSWTCAGQRHLVVLAVVSGMGHEWPGARPADGIKRVLRQPPVLDATTFLWTNLRSSVLS